MGKMKRMMVNPFQFGSRTEYGFEGGSAGLPQFQAHHDLCTVYTPEWSVRIWEPGRNALSMPGYADAGDERDRGVQLPLRAKIHGIKGQLVITMGMGDDDYGYWTDENGEVANPQPTKEQTRQSISGWLIPRNLYEDDTVPSLGPNGPNDLRFILGSLRAQVRIPFFVALYRGTYKYIDDQSGAEIDSGPGDDPAVILGIDITNPSVLESSRIDWWDVEYILPPQCLAPVAVYGQSYSVDDGLGETNYREGHLELSYSTDRGGYHKYPLNLDANKVLGPDQVLWLHVKTGGVKCPVIITDPPPAGGGPAQDRLTCLTYWGHSFTASLQASMLVSTDLEI